MEILLVIVSCLCLFLFYLLYDVVKESAELKEYRIKYSQQKMMKGWIADYMEYCPYPGKECNGCAIDQLKGDCWINWAYNKLEEKGLDFYNEAKHEEIE